MHSVLLENLKGGAHRLTSHGACPATNVFKNQPEATGGGHFQPIPDARLPGLEEWSRLVQARRMVAQVDWTWLHAGSRAIAAFALLGPLGRYTA